MPYPPEHKQAIRERIVTCARRLFNQRGFTEVSIDQIMADAGLTRGGFYNHFKAKEDLYAETLAAYGRERQAQGPADASDCGPELPGRWSINMCRDSIWATSTTIAR